MSALEENKLGMERVSRLVCARLSGIVLVGVHGIDNGLIPIVAYNYGVSNKSGDESAAKRVSDAVKWALVMSAGLQGLSMGMSSMVVTMARQALLPLIFAFALSRTGELDYLWFSFVLAELAGLPLAVFFWKRGYRKGLREPLA